MQVTRVDMSKVRDEDLVTLSEVAVILRVPVNTVRWWRQQGTGPRFFKVGRRLVITYGELRRWISDQDRGIDPGAA
jgi:hypothetical protein